MTTDGSLVALFHTPNIYSRSNSPSAGHLSTCLDFRLRLRGHFGWHGLSTVLQQWQHPALGAQSYQGAGADWADAATVFLVAVLDAFGGMFAGQLLPSGNWTVCYWKWPFSSLIYPWKRLWFSIISYVSSPEGSWEQCFAGRWRCSLFLNLTPGPSWSGEWWWMFRRKDASRSVRTTASGLQWASQQAAQCRFCQIPTQQNHHRKCPRIGYSIWWYPLVI